MVCCTDSLASVGALLLTSCVASLIVGAATGSRVNSAGVRGLGMMCSFPLCTNTWCVATSRGKPVGEKVSMEEQK